MRKPKRSRERRTYDPEGTRRRIIDIAFLRFHAHGYHATSTHDVMRAAKVTSGAFHHHFPTKRALGLAVIRERVAEAVEETWVRPVLSAATGTDGIGHVFKTVATSLDERGTVMGCPLNNLVLELSLSDRDFRRELNHVFDHWTSALADKLAGTLGTRAAAAELATFVVAAYSGAMAMAKASQSSAPVRSCGRLLAQLMTKASSV